MEEDVDEQANHFKFKASTLTNIKQYDTSEQIGFMENNYKMRFNRQSKDFLLDFKEQEQAKRIKKENMTT